MIPEQFDAIVIGAGEAGSIVASRAVEAGHKIAVIYRPPFGSTCLNTGCVPSKFMIHRARIAHVAQTAARFHVHTGSATIDLKAILQEKNADIVHHRNESLESARAADGLTLIEGGAKFLSKHEVAVSDRRLESDKIFIATGMRPLIPKIEGLDAISFLTNESVMELTDLPPHLVVIGGGYIGCELGQTFRRFGSQVTIIQQRRHLVPEEDPDISTVLEQVLADEGIDILLEQSAVRVEKNASGIRLTLQSAQGEETNVEGTHLLIAAGRRPNSDLNVKAAGVETDNQGAISVNEYLETNVSGIWAIGDVNGQQPFTRVCQEEGKVAFANAFEGKRIRMERHFLGHAVFTDPEIGRVGLTVQQARHAGHDAVTGLVTFDQIAKAKLMGETLGLIKYVFDRKTHRLLGCHVIGPNGADLIYDAIVVMCRGGAIDELARAVGIFPTLQEGMEGTARALLRKIAPQEVTGPLIAGSVHHEGPCFPPDAGSLAKTSTKESRR